MKFPTLLNNRANETDSSETEHSPQSNRRRFLKTLGVVGVGLAVAPTDLIASPLKSFLSPTPNAAAAWLASCEDWRTCVQRFVSIVANGDTATANWINRRLDDSEIKRAPYRMGFHYRYAPIHAFETQIDREEVICGNGFMVNLFPFYGVDCTCESYKDLNTREMARLTNAREMAIYKCVLAPAGERERPDQSDHTNYQALLARHYKNHNSDDFTLAYTRPVVNVKTGQPETAYGINYTKYDPSNTSSGDVLISKDNV